VSRVPLNHLYARLAVAAFEILTLAAMVVLIGAAHAQDFDAEPYGAPDYDAEAYAIQAETRT
jgi:hypothetical protein